MDAKRVLAHILPGFLLFAGVLMVYDILASPDDRISTNIILDPSTNNTTLIEWIITLGLSIGFIFGVIIDALGHNVFEHHFFKFFNDYAGLVKAEERAFKYWMIRLGLASHFDSRTPDYLYEFADSTKTGDEQATNQSKTSLKKQLIDEYYSYFEFYLNSGISLLLVSLVVPVYMVAVLHTSTIAAYGGFAVVVTISILLLVTSYHTLTEYRKTRLAMLEARLRTREWEKQSQAPLGLSLRNYRMPEMPPAARDYDPPTSFKKREPIYIDLFQLCFNPASTYVKIATVFRPANDIRNRGDISFTNGSITYSPFEDGIHKIEFLISDTNGVIDGGTITLDVFSKRSIHHPFSGKTKERLKKWSMAFILIIVPAILGLIFTFYLFPHAEDYLPNSQHFAVPATLSFTLDESNDWLDHQSVIIYAPDEKNFKAIVDPELKNAIDVIFLNGTKPQNMTITVDGSKLPAANKGNYHTVIFVQNERNRNLTAVEANIYNTPSLSISQTKVTISLNSTELKSEILTISNPNQLKLVLRVGSVNDLSIMNNTVTAILYPDQYPQRLYIAVDGSKLIGSGITNYMGYVVLLQPGNDRPIAVIDILIKCDEC